VPLTDPADRFLAATADVYDLVLATADGRLLAGRVPHDGESLTSDLGTRSVALTAVCRST
jgi:hypothetical protein